MIYKLIVDKQPMTNPSTDKKEYEFDIDQLYYKHDVYDAIVITLDEDYVIRRLRLGENNVLFIRDTPLIEPLPDLNIELFEGDNYIYVYDNTGTTLYAEYLIKNEFNELYVVYSEMNSAITQSKNEIRLEVASTYETVSHATEQYAALELSDQQISTEVSKKVGDDEIISKINQTAEQITINANKIGLTASDVLNIIAGNTINLTSKNIAINSTNFSVDTSGNMTCSNANVTGGNINLTTDTEDPTTVSSAVLSVKYSNTKYALYSSSGFYIRNGSNYIYTQGQYLYFGGSSGTMIGNGTISKLGGTVYGVTNLYNNTTGTSGTVNLSDYVSDYTYIRIYYKLNSGAEKSVDVYSPSGKTVMLDGAWSNTDPLIQLETQAVSISGASITRSSEYYANLIPSGISSLTSSNVIKITRVDGYK